MRVKVKDLLESLSSLSLEDEVVIYNPEARCMSNVHSSPVLVVLQKFEQLAPECYGIQKGDRKLTWKWKRKVVIVSDAHQEQAQASLCQSHESITICPKDKSGEV